MIDLPVIANTVTLWVTQFGFRILGAIVIWAVGVKLGGMLVRLLARTMDRSVVDQTTMTYMVNTLLVAIKIVLAIVILGFLGVETTSFAALLAAAGIAIGAAWSGLLANFAAGAFLVVFRPFKVGDAIEGGGVVGTVKEIGLFVTTVDAGDNVRTYVGNSKLFSDNIKNFSANPHRRAELNVPLPEGVDLPASMNLVMDRVARIPHVLESPAPAVAVTGPIGPGPWLTVSASAYTPHFGEMKSDLHHAVWEAVRDTRSLAPAQREAERDGAEAPPPAPSA
jgi:small conductance mechanosensitive channel